MNWLEFIAALVQGLAWPIVILVIALLFRSEIRGLLSAQVRRLKAGPLEIEWERQVANVEAAVGIAPTTQPLGADSAHLAEELSALAASNPPAAVFAAHDRVLTRLRDLAGGGKPGPIAGTAIQLAHLAAHRGLVNAQTARAIEGITHLRNLAASNPATVTAERALDYLATADMVMFLLDEPRKASQAGA